MGEDWIGYQRAEDGERLGWIVPRGAGFVPVNLLGRPLSGPVEWTEAEQALETEGLGYLAEIWELETPQGVLRVRIRQVTPEQVRVITDNYGAIDIPSDEFILPIPAPDTLRALGGDTR
jgi:hypothetical protein